MKTKKIIGILGGMGPESTAIFYQALIWQCQKQYGAKYDEDFPEILAETTIKYAISKIGDEILE